MVLGLGCLVSVMSSEVGDCGVGVGVGGMSVALFC